MSNDGKITQKNDGKDKKKILKIMLIGETAVGKSSIMYRYTMNTFTLSMMGTAGIDFKKKELEVDNQKIKIVLYDSAGHDRFRQIIKNHCKGAHGIVLVYDIGEEKSIERLSNWMDDVKDVEKDAEVVLVGNKCDIEQRKVSYEQGQELAKKFNIPWLETSAKTGYNIEETFDQLIKSILKKEKDKIEKPNLTEIKSTPVNVVPNVKKKEEVGCKCLIF